MLLVLSGQTAGELYYLRTTASDFAGLDDQVALLNSTGLHVRHIFPPNELIAKGNSRLSKSLAARTFVEECVSGEELGFRGGLPQSDGSEVFGVFTHLVTEPTCFDAAVVDESAGTSKLMPDDRSIPGRKMVCEPRTAEPDRFTANYMLGRTAVALLFVESNGGSENWTASSKQAMLNGAIQGFDWWCDKGEDRGTNISFVYELHTEIPVATEPIEQEPMPKGRCISCEGFWTFSWVGEALDFLGYAGEWDEVFRHCNSLRQTYQCNWAFEMFLANAENDADHNFKSWGRNAYSMGYDEVRYCKWSKIRNSQIVVVAYSTALAFSIPATLSHEIGHIYGAADEYKASEGGCSDDDCGNPYGYLRVDNGNCLTCNDRGVSCMMRYNTDQLCDYTIGHIGWKDSDGDGVSDAIQPNNGGWMSITNVNPGDLVRIYTIAGDFVNLISVTADNLATQPVNYVIWDGHNYDNQICATHCSYLVSVNDGEPSTRWCNGNDPVNPVFTDISYSDGNLHWNLDKSFAYVRCFIYDASDNLIARPIWDKLYSPHYPQSLDMDFLPSGQIYTARFYGWCPDGGKSQTVNYTFTHQCTHCGDADNNGTVDIADPVFIISHIFTGGPAPLDCGYSKGMGDANGDQALDISDAVYLISRIFSGGAAPHCFGM
jgi:hypothetical protein